MLIFNVSNFFNQCADTKCHEYAMWMMDVIWPVLENHHCFVQLHNNFALAEKEVAQIQTNDPRLPGRYYHVALSGQLFGDEDGKVYIYREKLLTHLYDLKGRLINEYASKVGSKEKIKFVTEMQLFTSGLALVYVMITFVEPYIKKKGQRTRPRSSRGTRRRRRESSTSSGRARPSL